ncbi:Re/Si-specific NAD(P)(+) transhydrogenase subunit alpha [Rhodococcus opacus]|uniref:Re/Si-specific NAD(P)(+) transhydrogenase subunit alpha n=1 Tax=Rhodococcus opacus TaxID=37919 RepID=UPI0002A4413C|nr:Re/Si-specific NAD(P)(+) transhydrogenase subunit alpha [Rhodococcus opacus]ELB93197.1 NAD(P) transhydrogenase subunit alpha [Rhodococcus wratislaviensis IFP 2016]MDX5965277.1 Re/Si-specific NAD(P)(+) transhydrogenase subunit alpha [Rhodococcus opacus]NKY76888.1 Re/Si-specific NAD(P)(+) transhydrogenase subunit alpha [Rhodococcus opacus]CAG7618791.1 NAD(P) transhydrogenase subunit alpha [Rhodococcus opacus]
MLIGVLKENKPGETRVAATPATVIQLRKLGYDVVVETGAGERAAFSNAAYAESGATIGDPLQADIVFGVNAPASQQLDGLSPGATLVAILSPALKSELVDDLSHRPITALAMDAVPRISRAQSLDVLSSMANIAGYRAVVEAAHAFGRFFTGQVTAAGKVPPATVLVAGAGVAGLAAIGAAGSLGAVVKATDPRPEVADQVRSLGGEYLSVEAGDIEVSATGYAKEMSADYNTRASDLYAATVPQADIVITTALIPGRPAPRLITAAMVASMKPGSVIVDMAAASGGNVEGTVPGAVAVTDNGVTIIGYTDLVGRLPAQSSQLYGTNLVNLMKLMTPGQDGELVLDFDDVIVRSITVVRDGESTWPPPPVQVSAAPAPTINKSESVPVPTEPKQPVSARRKQGIVGIAAALLFALIAVSPPPLQVHLSVFALAIVIGYFVIGNVHHALHTPLMSVTNAISGIIVVGAILQIGHDNVAVTAISSAAILLASINIFGGFAVTRRMLAMFSRS